MTISEGITNNHALMDNTLNAEHMKNLTHITHNLLTNPQIIESNVITICKHKLWVHLLSRRNQFINLGTKHKIKISNIDIYLVFLRRQWTIVRLIKFRYHCVPGIECILYDIYIAIGYQLKIIDIVCIYTVQWNTYIISTFAVKVGALHKNCTLLLDELSMWVICSISTRKYKK